MRPVKRAHGPPQIPATVMFEHVSEHNFRNFNGVAAPGLATLRQPLAHTVGHSVVTVCRPAAFFPLISEDPLVFLPRRSFTLFKFSFQHYTVNPLPAPRSSSPRTLLASRAGLLQRDLCQHLRDAVVFPGDCGRRSSRVLVP